MTRTCILFHGLVPARPVVFICTSSFIYDFICYFVCIVRAARKKEWAFPEDAYLALVTCRGAKSFDLRDRADAMLHDVSECVPPILFGRFSSSLFCSQPVHATPISHQIFVNSSSRLGITLLLIKDSAIAILRPSPDFFSYPRAQFSFIHLQLTTFLAKNWYLKQIICDS